MNEVARTIRRFLTIEAAAALEAWWEVAMPASYDRRFGVTANHTTLLHGLARIGGTWQDVLDLVALHEPALAWLDIYTAATVWQWRPTPNLVPERTAA